MVQQIEISSFDLRFEAYRVKNEVTERNLIVSILENGIRDPLQGVDTPESRILLNGFKRYRCAKKLHIAIVPYCCLANDEAFGIIELLRLSNAKSLSILEQAKLIDELKNVYHISIGDIAGLLNKSKAWVSVRSGIIQEMSQIVQDRIFSGQFPVYAYMYILRPFMRINKIKPEQIDEFVNLTAGKELSLRDIEVLANCYFKGSDEIRQQIKAGNMLWVLKSLKYPSHPTSECMQIEQSMLKDLELTRNYMLRIICKCSDTRYKTGAFFAQANLLSEGILGHINTFDKAMREFHDRSGKA